MSELGNPEPLSRVFLDLGPFTIYWYGVIIATGLFIGLWMATKESQRLGLPKDIFVDLLVFAIPIAILSARIYYVIFEWNRFKDASFIEMIAVWEGGIAIHGALIGSVLTALVFARVRKVSFWKLADIAAPSIILGQAVGRWGNFMNQEAHGGPVSESFYENVMQYFPDFIVNQMVIDGTLYHPTFLYESVWNFLVLALLLYLRRVNPKRGEIFLTYVIAYSIGRFFIEGMRTDSLYVFEVIRMAQAISVALVVGAVLLMIFRRRQNPDLVSYDYVEPKKKAKGKKKSKKK
ncbi:prolipoprotein diacylglyceryl transferase [Pontibacillus halophilus JSM 076056 = DSM 19796]|uniref:Phosphatidylglycerol--prolipoprotein diacylglyceryl transferase n=1 Tax=Pontibacillus halophilus JSM 076056 = DSM 19796 TaxID=1385510 RepID=A0A0A5GNV8_9BACI|nr:prolipoprotein diacylglyceryl transferase [Pontibacillus halophilus]KGX92923.1 prolipoprotein diacylglyceryl transferase [Pontibacillus halophilus JSM 076056 = DSM 19796]